MNKTIIFYTFGIYFDTLNSCKEKQRGKTKISINYSFVNTNGYFDLSLLCWDSSCTVVRKIFSHQNWLKCENEVTDCLLIDSSFCLSQR